MSKKLILAIAVLSFVFTGAAFAAVENIKVSGDINAEAVARDFALGDSSIGENDDNFLFSQIRLRFDADLTEGVSGVVSLINERIWGSQDTGTTDNGNTSFDLYEGYVELKEFLYQPLTLKIGRQNIGFGNELIIGDSGTATNVTPAAIADLTHTVAFDAVRAIFDYAPYTLDVVYAKVDENTINRNDDVTLFGANLAYDWSSFNGVTEVYFFGADNAPGTTTDDANSRVYATGARTQFDPSDKITLGLEGAYQYGAPSLSAFAVQTSAEYRFLNDHNSKVGLNYTYLSGDDADSESDNAWNSFFENNLQNSGEIIHILSTNSNLQLITATASCMPKEDITLGLLYTHARLAENLTGTTYTVAAAGAANANVYTTKSTNNQFGDEIDIYGIYDYTEDVQLKISGAFFVPGDVFSTSNDNNAYSIRGGVNVSF